MRISRASQAATTAAPSTASKRAALPTSKRTVSDNDSVQLSSHQAHPTITPKDLHRLLTEHHDLLRMPVEAL